MNNLFNMHTDNKLSKNKLIPGSKLEVVQNFDYDLGSLGWVFSCRFMSAPKSKQDYVALSGTGSDKTYFYNVSKQIRQPVKSKSSQKSSSNQSKIYIVNQFYFIRKAGK